MTSLQNCKVCDVREVQIGIKEFKDFITFLKG